MNSSPLRRPLSRYLMLRDAGMSPKTLAACRPNGRPLQVVLGKPARAIIPGVHLTSHQPMPGNPSPQMSPCVKEPYNHRRKNKTGFCQRLWPQDRWKIWVKGNKVYLFDGGAFMSIKCTVCCMCIHIQRQDRMYVCIYSSCKSNMRCELFLECLLRIYVVFLANFEA